MKNSRFLPLLVCGTIFIVLLGVSQLLPIAAQQSTTTATPTIASEKLIVTKLEDTDDGSCDPDDCSLREAIESISEVGIISFADGLLGTVLLESTLEIRKIVTIVGKGEKSEDLILKTNQIFNSFHIFPNGKLKLIRLMITARDDLRLGGTILNEEGELVVNDCTLHGIRGWSAIMSIRGDVVVERSLFFDNNATVGAAIQNIEGSLVVINSTFTNNRATHGGAVVDVVGKTKIMFSTFANNSGQTASTLSSSGTMEVWASTIYGTQIYEDYCAGNIVDQGGNLQFPNADCGDAIPVSDPKLLSLGDYGGATQTFALDSGSPAIDSVPASICQQLTQLVDQRGLPRDVQACDSGAYEE